MEELPPVAVPISDKDLSYRFVEEIKQSVNDTLWSGDNSQLLNTIAKWQKNLSYVPEDEQEKMIRSLAYAMGLHNT